jgi:molybdopterin-guanine dinucleotide biosynthesis protein A
VITAAILTGGRARRLAGRDKSRLLVGGETIMARQVRELKVVASEILVVGNEQERFEALALPVVPDVRPGMGSLGGIYTALVSARHERVLVIGCDMPFLTAAFLSRVVEESVGVDIAMPRTQDGWQPLCACYHRRCEAAIARRLETGQLRVVDMIPEFRVREIAPDDVARFDPYGDLLMNVNTPEDLSLARARARARSLTP